MTNDQPRMNNDSESAPSLAPSPGFAHVRPLLSGIPQVLLVLLALHRTLRPKGWAVELCPPLIWP